jgi:hypothetical protein
LKRIPNKLPPVFKATDAEVRASKDATVKFAVELTRFPRPEVAFKVPTIHVTMSGPLVYEFGKGILKRHRHLALDAASITDGVLDRLTPTQLHWLLFNGHVRMRVVQELSMAIAWEKQLFGTAYQQDLEVIEAHLMKVAEHVATSIGILRDMGKL